MLQINYNKYWNYISLALDTNRDIYFFRLSYQKMTTTTKMTKLHCY